MHLVRHARLWREGQRGAACKELTQTVKRRGLHSQLCRSETTWEVEKFREEIALLIAHGADVRARRKGYTALHVAAKYGNANAVKACLTVSLEGLSSEDALDLELEMQSQAYGYDRGEEAREDLARMQRNEQGMRIDVKTDALGLNCAHLAAARNHVDVLEVLDELEDPNSATVPKDCLFDSEDRMHVTPAMYAAEKGMSQRFLTFSSRCANDSAVNLPCVGRQNAPDVIFK